MLATAGKTISAGLLDYLYLGVKLGIYPCLIFMGVGAGTDFGPLISNPKTLLLGAAAQLGIFMTFIFAYAVFGFLRCGSGRHRHHRRRGRPDGDLADGQARPAPPWPDRGVRRTPTWRWCLSFSRRLCAP